MNIPCKDCICLSICKAKFYGSYFRGNEVVKPFDPSLVFYIITTKLIKKCFLIRCYTHPPYSPYKKTFNKFNSRIEFYVNLLNTKE